MSVNVAIKNRQRRFKLESEGVKKLVSWVLREEGCPEAEVSLLFVNDDAIRRLNRHYLGRDYPTDVLAFPQREGKGINIHSRLLGDVVISTQRIREQAPIYQKKTEAEFALCLIHGVLHLLGYRDHPSLVRSRMRRRQEELLTIWEKTKKWNLIKS